MIISNINPKRLKHLQDFLDLELLSETAFLSGGAAMSIVDNTHTFDDYDVFFQITPRSNTSNAKSHSDVEHKEEITIPTEMVLAAEVLLGKGFSLIYRCPKNSVFSYKKGEMKIQLIQGRLGNIEDVISMFDMFQCKVAYDGKNLISSRETLRCIFNKQIKLSTTVSNPIRTLARVMKYHKNKNYNIDIHEIYNMCAQNQQRMSGDDIINDLSFYL